jgi:hypothetical protein
LGLGQKNNSVASPSPRRPLCQCLYYADSLAEPMPTDFFCADGHRRHKLSVADGFVVPTTFFAACLVRVSADSPDKKLSAQYLAVGTLTCVRSVANLSPRSLLAFWAPALGSSRLQPGNAKRTPKLSARVRLRRLADVQMVVFVHASACA